MAVKIKMLKKKLILVHNVMGKVGETYKVNNEIGEELVSDGDAEYVDPELQARIKVKKPEVEVESEMKEEEKVESAAMEVPEKAIKRRPKGKKWGK